MTCASPHKIKHTSKEAAKAAIRSLYRSGRGNPDYRAYPCDGHWHVGHSQERLGQRIRRALRRGRRG